MISLLFCNNDSRSDDQSDLYLLQSQFDELYAEGAMGAFVRSRSKWLEDGEKNSIYFHNFEKQRHLNFKY